MGADVLLRSFCLQSDASSLPSLFWRVPQGPGWDLLSVSSPLITSQRPLEFEIVQLSIILSYLQVFLSLFSSPSTKPLAHLPPVHPACGSPSFLLFPRVSFPIVTSFLEFVLLLHLPATLDYRRKEQIRLKC